MTETRSSSKSSSDKLVPVLVLVTIAMAFGLGVMWQKVSGLQGKPSTPTNNVADTNNAENAPTAPSGQIAFGKLTAEQAAAVAPVSDKDHVRGSSDAKVYLIEYSDLECPFCEQFHTTAQQAVDDYAGEVAWVYRHFPLDQIHPNARSAAEAAECAFQSAGDDGFWKFVDVAFANQSSLSDLGAVATKAGLNASTITSCLDGGDQKDMVDSQYQTGVAAGVTGTPGSFVVNEAGEAWFLPGAYPITDLKGFIDEALGNS